MKRKKKGKKSSGFGHMFVSFALHLIVLISILLLGFEFLCLCRVAIKNTTRGMSEGSQRLITFCCSIT